MIFAENYQNIFKFVKVTHKILWTLFSGHGVYYVGENKIRQCSYAITLSSNYK